MFRSLTLSLLALQCFAHPAQSTTADTLPASIDRIVQQYKGNRTPGLTIGIIDKGVLVFQKSYGMANLEQQQPNTPATVYRIASLSKQFTAAAVLSLVQQNRLSLNDNVRKYLTTFPDYGKPVTIADLLYHTSGIRDYMVLMWLCGNSFEDKFTNQDALEIIYRQTVLNFTPGQRCVYSNSNYILLAEIIRQVTGMPFQQYAGKTIFTRLNMRNTSFGYAQKTPAVSYSKNKGSYTPYKNLNATMGDGGLFTTLADLVKWDQAFYDSLSLNYRLLQRGRLENGNILTYGMGIMTNVYRTEPIHTHPGAFLGYRAEMLRFPRRNITIICLSNTEEVNPESLTRRIADAYVFKEAITEPGLPAQVIKHAPLTGKYEVAPNVFIDITYNNDLLSGQLTGQPAQILYPAGANSFRIGQTEDKLEFSEEIAGGMQLLTVQQRQGNTKAERVELITSEKLSLYTGTYYCAEQKASYKFFIQDNTLWFTVGANPGVKADILTKSNKVYFSYKGLETAIIEFSFDGAGKINGFSLNTGRVTGLKFERS